MRKGIPHSIKKPAFLYGCLDTVCQPDKFCHMGRCTVIKGRYLHLRISSPKRTCCCNTPRLLIYFAECNQSGNQVSTQTVWFFTKMTSCSLPEGQWLVTPLILTCLSSRVYRRLDGWQPTPVWDCNAQTEGNLVMVNNNDQETKQRNLSPI